MSSVKRILALLALAIISQHASGQAARSPFTNLTIGEPYGNALIHTQGMAGVGVAHPQDLFLNNQNPALLVYNRVTVFQGGIIGERRTLRNDTASERSTGGNLNYLATAFPVVERKWTTSFGLMPYTNLRYKIHYIDIVQGSSDSVTVSEEGSGGLTQFYWSNGVRLHRNLAVGVKAAYIFSSVLNTYTNQLVSSDQPVNYPVSVEEKLYVRDFAFSAGLSYSLDSLFRQNRHRLSFGLVYDLETDLSTAQRYRIYRRGSGGVPIDTDTLYSSSGSLFIPQALTAGLSISRINKWTLAAEVKMQDWTAFRNPAGTNDDLGQAWRAALGWEYTPDIFSSNYFKRVMYRAGVHMEQLPFTRNNNAVKDIGINFGFSLPAGVTGRSSVDMAFTVGKRGDRSQNVLEENYFKIYFGVTFNDRWFIKHRFN